MISSKATTTILLLGTPPDDQISIFLLMYFQLCVCVCVCVCVFVRVCFIHFRLFPFPTKKKNPRARDSWRKIINWSVDLKGWKLWEPSKDSRVCSKNFIDGELSNENPYPTRNLGYDATKRTLFLSPPSIKKKSVMAEKMEFT